MVTNIGKIGIEQGSPALQIFQSLISSHQNKSLLLSIAEALDEINRFGDPEIYKSSLSLLLDLSAGDMPKPVREKSRAALHPLDGRRQ